MSFKTILTIAFTFIFFVLNGTTQAHIKGLKNAGNNSETYKSITFDGSWSRFTTSNAMFFNGKYERVYSSWTNSYGDIFISSYDYIDGKFECHKLIDSNGAGINGLKNPIISIDSLGYLFVFYTDTSTNLHLLKSTCPENIFNWNSSQKLTFTNSNSSDGFRNYLPVQLLAEKDKMFVFWLNNNGEPAYSTSSDSGNNWSETKTIQFSESDIDFKNLVVSSTGKDRIHIVLSGQSKNLQQSKSLHYLTYFNGNFYNLKGIKQEIFSADETTVYLTSKTNKSDNFLLYDIADDAFGKPVIAYSIIQKDSSFLYCYAKWDGRKWLSSELINSGKWRAKKSVFKAPVDFKLTGGMSINKATPNTVYLSVNRDSIFEIEKWTLHPNNKKWIVEFVTSASNKDNFHPLAVKNSCKGKSYQLQWLQNTEYIHYGRITQFANESFHTAIKCDILSPVTSNPLDSAQIIAKMCQAADWQLANPDITNRREWLWGAFYIGLYELYKITKDQRYLAELINVGKSTKWQPLSDIFHADRLPILDVWTSLYDETKRPEMIDKTKFVLDVYLARGFKNLNLSNYESKNPTAYEWWTWCDALYMAPQVFAHISGITGEKKYLDYMNTYWWKVSDYLYSKEDSLYYRDDHYLTAKSKNGKKIFWARGNGWVVGGLARVLDLMPKTYPDRIKYENQFKQMTVKLLSLQRADGLWTVSLYDPEELPMGESSASCFYTFALAWGINNGLVDAKYKPNVLKAWAALTERINNKGQLGHVQQVAAKPFPFKEDEWHVYATGTYFMAGKEILKLIKK